MSPNDAAPFADAPTVRDVLDLAAVMPLLRGDAVASRYGDRWHRRRALEVLDAVFVDGCAMDAARTRIVVLTTPDDGPSLLLRQEGRADIHIACYEPMANDGRRLYGFGYRNPASDGPWLWGDQVRSTTLGTEIAQGSILDRLSRNAA